MEHIADVALRALSVMGVRTSYIKIRRGERRAEIEYIQGGRLKRATVKDLAIEEPDGQRFKRIVRDLLDARAA